MNRPTIATLGPPGTCSEEVALAYLKDQGVPEQALLLCESYETALQMLLQGEADKFVLAAAYRHFHEIVFANMGMLRLKDVLHSRPRFVLAVRNGFQWADAKAPLVVASHASPAPLLQAIDIRHTWREAASNARAAHLLAAGEVDLAITNETSLRALTAASGGQSPLQTVREFGGIDMIWGVYERASAERDETAFRRSTVDAQLRL